MLDLHEQSAPGLSLRTYVGAGAPPADRLCADFETGTRATRTEVFLLMLVVSPVYSVEHVTPSSMQQNPSYMK